MVVKISLSNFEINKYNSHWNFNIQLKDPTFHHNQIQIKKKK